MKRALQTLVRKAETWLGKLETEVITSNTTLKNMNQENPITNANPNEQSSNISRDHLQEFLSTVMQGIK